MKTLKDLVKKNPGTSPTFGTDPSNPWATKHNVSEASERELLSRYLNSRGINPEFVGTDSKIAHAKSSEYSKWKMDHLSRFAREETIPEAKTIQGTALDKFRQAAAERARKHDDIERAMKARHAAGKEDMKGSIDRLQAQLNKEETEQVVNEMDTYPHPDSKKGKALMKAFKSSAKKDPTDLNAPGKSPTVKQTTSALLPMLNKSFKKSMKTEEVEQIDEATYNHKKAMQSKNPRIQKKGIGAAMDNAAKRIQQTIKDVPLNSLEKRYKEEVELTEVSKSEVDSHFHNWTNSEHAPYNSDAGDDNKVHQSALSYLSSTNVPKEKHKKLAMHIAHKFHGSGIDEEVEQIDELKKSTVFSWLKQQPVVPEKKPGMSRKDHNKKIKTSSKSWNRALDRLSGYKPTSEAAGKDELKMKEDAFQDPQAATQMPFDGANTTNDTDMKKREMTKSARIIKSIYKRKSMKEDMYDFEKDDKSVQLYGKKPKLNMTDKKDNVGENKPEARAVMAGGKTLTGQSRDMVEIDPAMKNRPDRPDTFDKGNPKKSPA